MNFAWIFFRMPTLIDAVGMIGRFFDPSLPKTLSVSGFTDLAFVLFGVMMLFLKDATDEFFPSRFKVMDNRHTAVRWCSYLLIMVAILLTGVFGADQFIYAYF